MTENENGEMLYGMSAIAAHLGVTKRQALYLKEKNRIPFFYIDSTICARRSTLTRWLADIEAKARTAGSAGN